MHDVPYEFRICGPNTHMHCFVYICCPLNTHSACYADIFPYINTPANFVSMVFRSFRSHTEIVGADEYKCDTQTQTKHDEYIYYYIARNT